MSSGPKVSSAMADNKNNTAEECDNGNERARDEQQTVNNEERSDEYSGDKEEEDDGGETGSGRQKRSIISPKLKPGYRQDRTGKYRKPLDNEMLQKVNFR